MNSVVRSLNFYTIQRMFVMVILFLFVESYFYYINCVCFLLLCFIKHFEIRKCYNHSTHNIFVALQQLQEGRSLKKCTYVILTHTERYKK